MLWEIDIHPAPGRIETGESALDRAGQRVAAAAAQLNLAANLRVAAARGFLLEGRELTPSTVERLAHQLLADSVVEDVVIGQVGDPALSAAPPRLAAEGEYDVVLVTVLPKPGVMDPVAQSAQVAIADAGAQAAAVRTFRKYWIAGASEDAVRQLASRFLANDAIEQVVFGPLAIDHLEVGTPYEFSRREVPLRTLDEEALTRLSREGQLYLQPAEMQTIQSHFRTLGREPTDVELETIAQTWSEHCSHKTLAGRIAYRDEHGERRFENMLQETIFAATQQIRAQLGDQDWCVSVFKDNAGVVRFDDEFNVAFKVETHNHPSALEPYGGANTGVGGVIRDIMGTGLGAKPICSTDVFCFAPPDTPADKLPPGVLHPQRVMQGVVEGVRDYGNRMGIPTVNGAVYFDSRYLGNPLVYCGNVGIIPHDKSHKQPHPGDLIVAIGGRTGRDGIHGATFSSAELTSHSESISGGAVQIGNAIEEKKVLDVLLVARDRGLYHAVTDCGAGGFSSAVGEMGEDIGAEVWLERAPLKYQGLSYTEIWISEAQERMVLAVPEDKWTDLETLCRGEDVEATVIGRFEPTGRLRLHYQGELVGDLAMDFLHNGRPPVVREASYTPPPRERLAPAERRDYTEDLLRILAAPNIASKEWIIRQYDHEVQGGSVVKPLVGALGDGPSDAAVLRPRLGSDRGIAVSCGMNPRYGDLDTYHMAASAIDEAVRNAVAVGADPARIALLDNFCWGDCEKPAVLGSLVRAAIACHDMAVALGTPFISGKDSLNNEFSYRDDDGNRQTIAIPPSLLISAIGQIDDVNKCVTMDLKSPGNDLYLVGETRDELGGSHLALVNDQVGGDVPTVDPARARATYVAVHRAMAAGLVRASHDISEGGLATAIAEMAFAGGYGAQIALAQVAKTATTTNLAALLFSESNSRLILEISPQHSEQFEQLLGEVPHTRIGEVTNTPRLTIASPQGEPVIDAEITRMKHAWQTLHRNHAPSLC